MKPIQAVLFDLDGVLADSEPLWNEIDTALLAEYGVIYGGEHKHQVLGKSFPLALAFYKDTFKLRQEVEEMALRRTAIAADFYATRIPIFPDAASVLQALRAMPLKIGLATSSVGELIKPFLARHDIMRFFHEIVTGEEVQRGKPHPDIYLRAAAKVGIAPEYCLVVEDALSGVQAATSAGMTVVAIPDPRFVDTRQYEGKTDYLLSHVGELPNFVKTHFQVSG
ncbi:MAG TPA: HAD family phosphatase [Abditibacteriaceae bacterium]|nr:HAD family phosphatase [Abditibacteriaceae bacterium]